MSTQSVIQEQLNASDVIARRKAVRDNLRARSLTLPEPMWTWLQAQANETYEGNLSSYMRAVVRDMIARSRRNGHRKVAAV